MPSEWDKLTLGKLWVLLDSSEQGDSSQKEGLTYSQSMKRLGDWRKEKIKPEDIPDHIDKKRFYDGKRQKTS